LTSNMQNLITTSCNDQMLLLAYKIITWNFALETLLQCVLENAPSHRRNRLSIGPKFLTTKNQVFSGKNIHA
jgi:hypothetical protein